MERDPEGKDGRIFEPPEHPVDFRLAGGGVGVATQGELGVGFGFKDEGSRGLGISLVGVAEGGERAGEMVEGILTDPFD